MKCGYSYAPDIFEDSEKAWKCQEEATHTCCDYGGKVCEKHTCRCSKPLTTVTYYFTFGAGSDKAKKYVKIEAEDYFKAREIMVGRFGLKWGMQYSEVDFAGQPEEYELTELLEDEDMIKNMVKVLVAKLTKEEFLALYELIDGDPPAGPFYCAIGDHAVKIAPELFVDGFGY